ncbi:OmpA family protein [Burkholderia sp. AU45274]|uniref:OmpA family protein n=1 Tax=Burkholderia sp. AU45274 TaxID=3059205 RepID=UPI00264D24E3|nr:OmpA family protein [Burkholderia sp. AU45274]MDN7487256.1 OmpA family protein [Burkholderia sp. AU45274]
MSTNNHADAASEAERADLLAKRVESISNLASFSYKIAAAAGALITLGYLFNIKFFPSGLTPGEVVFFVFVAIAFGFVYVVLLMYGAISSIWFVHLISFLERVYNRPPRTISAANWPSLRKLVSQRKIKKFARFRWAVLTKFRKSRKQVQERRKASGAAEYSMPREVQGGAYLFMSVMMFAVMVLLAWVYHDVSLARLLIAFFLAGFIALVITGLPAERLGFSTLNDKHSRPPAWVRWLFVAIIPLGIVLLFGGPQPLMNLVFERLGIRIPDVSIEVNESERGTIERISDVVGHPILDCRRIEGGRLLIHGADVLWTGVGNTSFVSFSVLEPKDNVSFGNDRRAIRYATLRLDTGAMRVVSAKPPINPCFDLANDMLFKTGSFELTSLAQTQLKSVMSAIEASGTPRRIVVRGHSDARHITGPLAETLGDNQRLSELRASAVATVLRRLIANQDVEIVSTGAGSREPKVKCPSETTGTRYEVEQCNAPNRRVEIRVTYARGGGKSGTD